MMRYALSFLLVGMCLGCGEQPAAPQAVHGTITLDGKPMPDGEVYFGPPGKPPLIFPISSGTFEGKAPEGKYLVAIRAYRPSDGENYIPRRFNDKCKWTAEITPSGPNEFSFAVESK